MSEIKKTGLDLMREEFQPHQISQKPQPTKEQTELVKSDFKKGIRCKICGQWHHPDVVHLDYVGHAALTDRLLDCDPHWAWEPMAVGPDGYPVVDKDGGMWIKLTVCGVTRLGYGDAQGKTGGNATKERIGDALRNAAMRFGAALELWHKGDLHKDKDEPTTPAWDGGKYLKQIVDQMEACAAVDALEPIKKAAQTMCEEQNDEPTYRAILAHYKTRKSQLTPKEGK